MKLFQWTACLMTVGALASSTLAQTEPKPDAASPAAPPAGGAVVQAAETTPPPSAPAPPPAPAAPLPPPTAARPAMIHPERYGLPSVRVPRPMPPATTLLSDGLTLGLPSVRVPRPMPPEAPAGEAVTTGVFEEEADQNPEAAIRSYQVVINGFDSQRANVANAIFRLGECYRKLGRMEEAKVQYARILREFTDLTRLVQISQQHLATPTPRPRPGGYGGGFSTGYPGAGGNTITPGQEGFTSRLRQILVPATSSTPPVYSVQGNPAKERELLAQEIALVEQQILIVKKQIENGTAAPEQLIPLQREILKLQRQMAALESVPETATAERPRTPEALVFGRPLPKTSSLIGQSFEDPGDKTAMLKRQLGMAQSERMDAENRQIRTQTLLRMVKESDPVNLPEKAAADPRYQELKKEYEKSVLAEDKAVTEKASQRLSIWVKSIYLPELEAAEKATRTEVDTWQKRSEALAAQLKDQQQEEEKRKQPAAGRF